MTWKGGMEAQEGGICIYIADPRCCIAESNTLKSNYTLIKNKLIKKELFFQ